MCPPSTSRAAPVHRHSGRPSTTAGTNSSPTSRANVSPGDSCLHPLRHLGNVAALKAAINTANINDEFDTINLSTNGLYTLTAQDNGTNGANGLPVVENDVSFGGTEIGIDLTINGNGARIERSEFASSFRILHVAGRATCAINNLNMKRGRVLDPTGAQGGGAIFNHTSQLILNGCSFDNNAVLGLNGVAGNPATAGKDGSGGAVCNFAAVFMSATNCTFTNNKADGGRGGNSSNSAIPAGTGGDGKGGALFCSNNALHLNNCTFIGNFGSGGLGGSSGLNTQNGIMRGGAVWTDAAFLDYCTFTSNSATHGGAVYADGNVVSLNSCTMTFNIATDGGGGIYNAGTATVTNCQVNDGRADSYGGGIFNKGALTISNSSFSGNTTSPADTRGGGAICDLPGPNEASFLTIRNTTFANNVPSSSGWIGAYGGALLSYVRFANSSAVVTVEGCTFLGNIAGGGGGGICHYGEGGSSSMAGKHPRNHRLIFLDGGGLGGPARGRAAALQAAERGALMAG